METSAASNTSTQQKKSKPTSPALDELRRQDEVELNAYLRSLSAETPIRVTVIRAYPKSWKGHNIGGSLDSYEDTIDEETIKETYGGGTYRLRIMIPGDNGGWQYFANRTLKIAGDPKVRGLINDENLGGEPGKESPSIVNQTLKAMGDIASRAEERAQRIEERSRHREPDPILRETLQHSREEARELRRQMEMRERRWEEKMEESRGASGHTEMLLGKFIDGESGRMQSLRMQHESELRSMRERHQMEIDRISSRADDIMRRAEDAHRREIDSINRSNDSRFDSLKLSQKTTEGALQRENDNLRMELTAVKTELAEYRAKRDKPVTDQLTEMMAIKNAFEEFGGGKDEGGGTLDKIAGTLSPLIEGVATRMAAGSAPPGAMMAPGQAGAPPQPSQEEIPVNQPVQMPDGRIIVRRADGSIVQLSKRQKRPMTPTGEEIPKLDPADVQIAVEFMENAVRNDTDPEQFAATARNLVPTPILKTLRSLGVDRFLTEVANIGPGSPLATVAGKNWARKVAQSLLGG